MSALSTSSQKIYRSLDILIDPARACVSRGGQELPLRAKAFLLLLYLVEHRDRVVGKDELFEHLWPQTSVSDATLTGCIQEIRRALSDQAREPRFVRTIPRMGYRFVAPVETVGGVPEAEVPAPQETAESVERIDAPAVAPRHSRRRLGFAVAGVAALIATSLAVAKLTQRPAPPSEEDLIKEVAWWKLDGTVTATDASGHGLTGAVTGASAEPGIAGGALRLGAPDSRIEGLDRGHVLPAGGAARTFSAWVKREGTNPDATTVVQTGGAAADARDAFRLFLLPDGRPALASSDFSGFGRDPSLAVGPVSLADGRWNHLVGEYANGRGALYINGVFVSETPMLPASTFPGEGVRWVIGNSAGVHNSFHGAVDDVRIYQRALRSSEIAALYRCTAGLDDVTVPGKGSYFFLPIGDAPRSRPSYTVAFDPSADGSGPVIRNLGTDYAGVQLAARRKDCASFYLRGSNIGQDLSMSVELLAPASPEGFDSEAGPYFRSRQAGAGDGLIGGTSAGYWVQLHSNGAVTVKLLNPVRTVAFSTAPKTFDSHRFHKLEAAVSGEALAVALDGREVIFNQDGRVGKFVKVPAVWDGPQKVGDNNGTAGLAFASEPLRFKAGGQQARHFTVAPYHPLAAR